MQRSDGSIREGFTASPLCMPETWTRQTRLQRLRAATQASLTKQQGEPAGARGLWLHLPSTTVLEMYSIAYSNFLLPTLAYMSPDGFDFDCSVRFLDCSVYFSTHSFTVHFLLPGLFTCLSYTPLLLLSSAFSQPYPLFLILGYTIVALTTSKICGFNSILAFSSSSLLPTIINYIFLFSKSI